MSDYTPTIGEVRGWYSGYTFGNPDRFAWVRGHAGTQEGEMRLRVATSEPEWEYAVRHIAVDGWPTVEIHESREAAERDYSTCGMNCAILRRVKDTEAFGREER